MTNICIFAEYTANIAYNFIRLEHNYRKLQQQKWTYPNFK